MTFQLTNSTQVLLTLSFQIYVDDIIFLGPCDHAVHAAGVVVGATVSLEASGEPGVTLVHSLRHAVELVEVLVGGENGNLVD